jgi:hypothetical protein
MKSSAGQQIPEICGDKDLEVISQQAASKRKSLQRQAMQVSIQ